MALNSPGAQFLRQQAESAISNFYSAQDGSDIGIPKRVHPNDLVEFKDHPFKVLENADMDVLMKSIEANGVREPLLVFYNEDKDLEIIAGHRRRYAAQKLGIESIPVLVMKISREDATFLMYESNKQRDLILPSERAKVYKTMIDAMGRVSGQRTDKNAEESGRSIDLLEKKIGVSHTTIQRYMYLNSLIPEILELVDQSAIKKNTGIAMLPAIEISYLPENFQRVILDIYKKDEKSPSHKQARDFKRLYEARLLDEKKIIEIMDEQKPNQKRSSGMVITNENLLMIKKNNGLADEAFQQLLVKALEFYQKHGQMQAAGISSATNKLHL